MHVTFCMVLGEQNPCRDRLYRVRLRIRPKVGICTQRGGNPEADAMKTVPTLIFFSEHLAKT